MNKKRLMWWSGLCLCILGGVVGARIPYFYWNAHVNGKSLVHRAQQIITAHQSIQSPTGDSASQGPLQPLLTGTTETLSDVSANEILGLLNVPVLNLTAPVLQSVSNTALNVGTGHLPQSARPGMPGTCVIAAHNATWFRHLDELKSGDKIILETKDGRYEYQVKSSSIISTQANIPNTAMPTIVLEACYPLGALYLTSKRFIVIGVLTGAYASSLPHSPEISPVPKYVAYIPAEILSEGVTLKENQLPMGLLRFKGKPSTQFTQSNAPLSAVYTTLQLYLAYVRASEDRNVAAIRQMFVNESDIYSQQQGFTEFIQSDPFFGTPESAISYLDKFDISLDVSGNTLNGVQASTTVLVPRGRYHIVLSSIVHENIFQLKTVTIQELNV